MLDPMSRKLLKMLTRFPSAPSAEEMTLKLNCSKESLLKLLDYLEERGYLHWDEADLTVYDITLTHAGEQYRAFEWLKTKDFLFRSILVPIAVSLVTSVLTLWITTLL
jgi:hypothetical protein